VQFCLATFFHFRVTVLQALAYNPANPTAYNNRGFARRKVCTLFFAALSRR